MKIFQSTPPYGRRHVLRWTFGTNFIISIHASVWEATKTMPSTSLKLIKFQSTPPYGRRPFFLCLLTYHPQFQSTPPYGRRPNEAIIKFTEALFQSTPPYGRRRRNSDYEFKQVIISIHASVWEATLCHSLDIISSKNFNPRLRMGGDFLVLGLVVLGRHDFNPRLRMGGDLHLFLINFSIARISIHASVWEATVSKWISLWDEFYFNPRLRMGGDKDKKAL